DGAPVAHAAQRGRGHGRGQGDHRADRGGGEDAGREGRSALPAGARPTSHGAGARAGGGVPVAVAADRALSGRVQPEFLRLSGVTLMDCGCGSSRREFLSRAGTGFGMLALASILKEEGLLAQDAARPLAPRTVHFTPKAKSVIFLFMSGGPSHVDLLEYKPELVRLAGQPIPESFGMFKT